MDIEKIVRENIDKTLHMSLATSKDNKPWVCEVHFAYDENLNLYFRSKPARRHSKEIATNPFVAGNIVRQHALGEVPLGVYFEGTAEKLEDDAAKQYAAKYIEKRLRPPFDVLADASDPEEHQFYKITVSKYFVFGKLDDSGAQKYELNWSDNQK